MGNIDQRESDDAEYPMSLPMKSAEMKLSP
jgi:hypothetical protein